MAISIKNRELEEVSRELARITGKPITEALLVGAKRELERQKNISRTKLVSDQDMDETMAFIKRIQQEYAAMPNPNPMTDDEILGYDEFGIPSK